MHTGDSKGEDMEEGMKEREGLNKKSSPVKRGSMWAFKGGNLVLRGTAETVRFPRDQLTYENGVGWGLVQGQKRRRAIRIKTRHGLMYPEILSACHQINQ